MKPHTIILSLFLMTLTGCTKSQTDEQPKTEVENTTETYSPEPEFDSVNLFIEETVQPAIPVPTPSSSKETGSNSYSSSSYSSSPYESESEGDYWEEKRKHSPNDNYLLGFDEDVDDVHDMELYIEDY